MRDSRAFSYLWSEPIGAIFQPTNELLLPGKIFSTTIFTNFKTLENFFNFQIQDNFLIFWNPGSKYSLESPVNPTSQFKNRKDGGASPHRKIMCNDKKTSASGGYILDLGAQSGTKISGASRRPCRKRARPSRRRRGANRLWGAPCPRRPSELARAGAGQSMPDPHSAPTDPQDLRFPRLTFGLCVPCFFFCRAAFVSRRNEMLGC